ncbi:MAG: NAD(P)H-hydrate epimerase, partial [Pseudomonadota bacterium]
LLSKRGWDVRVFSLADLSDLKGDPKRAAELWAGPVYPLREALNAAANVTLDALFGGGLSRALTGVAAELADQSPGQIVAVDVPSGLPGATGQPLGPCFCADLTVTFAALRPAHVLMPGKGLCGVVKVVDIGVPVESRNVFRETKAPIPESALQLRDLAALGDALGEHVAVSENRIEAVRLLCSLHQRAVLLRSPEWILADDDQQVSVSNT